MWELDCEESWVLKNWCFWTVVLEKTLASPLDCKEIQPVHPKGDQSWVFIGRTDAEAETPILWPPHAKSWLIGKHPDAGRDWGKEEKGMIEDEMAGLHHRLDGRESEWTPGVGDGQGGLTCCDSSGRKESDTTERLNWTELRQTVQNCSILALGKISDYIWENQNWRMVGGRKKINIQVIIILATFLSTYFMPVPWIYFRYISLIFHPFTRLFFNAKLFHMVSPHPVFIY